MRHRAVVLAAALLLAGCDGAPAAQNAAAPAAPGGPRFAVSADQASALVAALGAPWTGGTRKDGLLDARTGGTVRTVTGPEGSAQIFSWPGGGVWRVRLIAGGMAGCGDVAALRAAMPGVIARLSPTTRPTAAQLAAIGDDLIETTPRDHALPGALVSVIGGCRPWLTVTAR